MSIKCFLCRKSNHLADLVFIREVSAIIVMKLAIWERNAQEGVAEGYDELMRGTHGASVGKTVEKKENIKKKTSKVNKVADKDSDGSAITLKRMYWMNGLFTP